MSNQKQVEEIYVRPKLATSNDSTLAMALVEAQVAIQGLTQSGKSLSTIESRFVLLEVLEKHGYSIVKGTFKHG